MSKFYNDRRPSPSREGDSVVPVNKATVTIANSHILASTPAYAQQRISRTIKTAAVQRQRRRDAGEDDFESIQEYKNFVYGTQE
jgi:hypothetical protein